MEKKERHHSQRFVIFSSKSFCYLARVTPREITIMLEDPIQFVDALKKAKTFTGQFAISKFERTNNWKPTPDFKAYIVTEAGLLPAEEIEL